MTSPSFGTVPPLLGAPYTPIRVVRRPSEYVKRRAFFSFHFDDIMRVNNVRNAFKVWYPGDHRLPTFYDSSLWGQRDLTTDGAVKRLIREGVEYTSVVCVLAGTETWNRRWVRYEIARSVIDRKGLLVVDINGINHHVDRAPHKLGRNPLDYMAVGAPGDGTFRLYERKSVWTGFAWEWRWKPYADYTLPVALPGYLAAPLPATRPLCPVARRATTMPAPMAVRTSAGGSMRQRRLRVGRASGGSPLSTCLASAC